MVGARVCHSDYHVIEGHSTLPEKIPYVIRHEGAAVVLETGSSVDPLLPGDHVTFSLAGQCEQCRSCTVGRPNLYENFGPAARHKQPFHKFSRGDVAYYHAFGTFSEQSVVRANNLVKIILTSLDNVDKIPMVSGMYSASEDFGGRAGILRAPRESFIDCFGILRSV